MNHPQTGSLRKRSLPTAYEQYGHRPDTPFSGMPGSAVLRHPENKKWYAVFLTVPREKLGLPGDGKAEILDLKADPVMMGSLLLEPGILPAYHMQKASWVSVLLDGTADLQQICFLLDVSFSLTAARARKSRERAVHWPPGLAGPGQPPLLRRRGGLPGERYHPLETVQPYPPGGHRLPLCRGAHFGGAV